MTGEQDGQVEHAAGDEAAGATGTGTTGAGALAEPVEPACAGTGTIAMDGEGEARTGGPTE